MMLGGTEETYWGCYGLRWWLGFVNLNENKRYDRDERHTEASGVDYGGIKQYCEQKK